MLLSSVGSWPHPKTLDQAGKACQGQTLQLITKIRKLLPLKVLQYIPLAVLGKLEKLANLIDRVRPIFCCISLFFKVFFKNGLAYSQTWQSTKRPQLLQKLAKHCDLDLKSFTLNSLKKKKYAISRTIDLKRITRCNLGIVRVGHF